MISCLQGKILLREENFIILQTQNVGYKIFLSEKTLDNIPKNEQELKVFTFLRFREPAVELYGFLSFGELQLFETLNDISGVGPKSAMILASFGSLSKLKQAFEKQPDDFHKQVKGIGKKKLQKIILEISGKIKEISKGEPRLAPTPQKDEALEGLLSLGFSQSEAKQALAQVPKEIKDTESRVKQALKLLGQ